MSTQLIIETTKNTVHVDGTDRIVTAAITRNTIDVNPSTTLVLLDSVVEVTSLSMMSALRCVTFDGRYADPTDNTTIGIVGITLTAGTTVNARFSGSMQDGGWSWTAGEAIYCGANGILTHTAPATGWTRRVAEAISATEIIVNIHQPITD